MDGFLEVRSLIEHAAEGVGDEAAAPELHAALAAGAVDGDDGHAVGDGMAALYGLPGVVLLAVVVLVLADVPADGRGVEEYLGTHEGGDAAGFGVPLVPADEDADGGELGLEDLVAEVAGGKVEFLVVAGVVGNVHFAVFAEVGAVGVDDGRGVVVEAFGAFLEERADDDDAELFGQGHEVLAGGPFGDGFGEGEVLVALFVAEVERGEKFLQADDLGAAAGQFAHLFGVAFDVLLFVFHAAHLRDSHFYFHRFRLLWVDVGCTKRKCKDTKKSPHSANNDDK